MPRRTQSVETLPGVGDPVLGQQLGDYRVDQCVAEGGMGIVYSAVHRVLDRKAAVKVLRPEYANEPAVQARFFKEAQALSALKHRGIVDIYTFGQLHDGRQYMVTEFLEGQTLEALIRNDGRMEPVRALPIVDEILDALSAAHKIGVVHRDLKPSNVFMSLQSNGSYAVKLVDFGLARSIRGGQQDEFGAGTPEYISPEQIKGETVTAASDLYCLGVMMFEMLSGGLPFRGASLAELFQAHLEVPAPRLGAWVKMPPPIEGLVANLLEKQPARRPGSANAVRRTVAQILHNLSEESTDASIKIDQERLAKLFAERAAEAPMEDTYIRPAAPSSSPESFTTPVQVGPPLVPPPAPRLAPPTDEHTMLQSNANSADMTVVQAATTPVQERTLIQMQAPVHASTDTDMHPMHPSPTSDTLPLKSRISVVVVGVLVMLAGSAIGGVLWLLTK